VRQVGEDVVATFEGSRLFSVGAYGNGVGGDVREEIVNEATFGRRSHGIGQPPQGCEDLLLRACELWRKAHAILSKHFDRSHPHVVIVEKSLNAHCRPAPPPRPGS
jgi:hypothetical protein